MNRARTYSDNAVIVGRGSDGSLPQGRRGGVIAADLLGQTCLRFGSVALTRPLGSTGARVQQAGPQRVHDANKRGLVAHWGARGASGPRTPPPVVARDERFGVLPLCRGPGELMLELSAARRVAQAIGQAGLGIGGSAFKRDVDAGCTVDAGT